MCFHLVRMNTLYCRMQIVFSLPYHSQNFRVIFLYQPSLQNTQGETHYINCASQVFLCLLPDKTKELGTRFCTSSSHKSSSSSSFLSFFLWARLVSVMQCSSGHQTYLVFKSQGKSALLPTTAQLFPLQQQLSLLLKTKQKIAI